MPKSLHQFGHFSSKVKDIYLELPNYPFFHSPSGRNKPDVRFLGRKKLIKRMEGILRHAHSRSGAYLVTGYRGMGKTSLVRTVLRHVREHNSPQVRTIEMSLAQDELKDLDVIRHLARKMAHEYQQFFQDSTYGWLWQNRHVLSLIMALFAVVCNFLVAEQSLLFCYMIGVCIFVFSVSAVLFHFVIGKMMTDRQLYRELLDKEGDTRPECERVTKRLDRLVTRKILVRRSTAVSGLMFVLFSYLICWRLIYPRVVAPVVFDWPLEVFRLDFIWLNDQTRSLEWSLVVMILLLNLLAYSSIPRFLRALGVVTPNYLLSRFNNLVESIRAQVTLESGAGASLRAGLLFNWTRKRSSTYPMAQAKEVEYALIEILDALGSPPPGIFKHFWGLPEFIVVFDELDKIEPFANSGLMEKASEDPNLVRNGEGLFDTGSQRKRQEALAKLLSNLKHFLNVAQAKFIFIAGREMFDASLADISDRESFFGSVFHDVFYVESFYKDRMSDGDTHGITQMTEAYVCRMLFGYYGNEHWGMEPSSHTHPEIYRIAKEAVAANELLALRHYADFLKQHDQRELEAKRQELADELRDLKNRLRGKQVQLKYLKDQPGHAIYFQESLAEVETSIADYQEKIISSPNRNSTFLGKEADWLRLRREKIITTLQNYVNYLAYRSNGTPKQLSALFEDNLELIPESQMNAYQHKRDAIWVRCYDEKHTLDDAHPGNREIPRVFLRFNFQEQYVLGLTTYLIRPYLINHSGFLRAFGDKLLVSSTYLVDHLFKFHQHSFSWRNLELTPEVITYNKAPELRHFIEDLIQFLSHSLIREIPYGLFQFKFFKKVANEIIHVSRISETESAAFNFSLDESLLIKRHYYRKLKELQSGIPPQQDGLRREHINSVAFVNSMLGDLHFFDREFDDVIIHYTNTLQALRGYDVKDMTHFQFYLYLREKLKLALTLEKINVFETAMMHYNGVADGLMEFFIHHHRNVPLKTPVLGDKGNPWSAMRARNQTILQNLPLVVLPFVAELVLIEKTAPMGLTYDDLSRSQQKFEGLLKHVLDEKAYKKGFLQALFEHHLGTVLYFKNGSLLPSNQPPSHAIFKDRIKDYASKALSRDFRAPISAYEAYVNSLTRLVGGLTVPQGGSSENAFEYVFPDDVAYIFYRLDAFLHSGSLGTQMQTVTKSEWEQIGSCLSKMGDCVLCLLLPGDPKGRLSCTFLGEVFGLLADRGMGEDFGGYSQNAMHNIVEKVNSGLAKPGFWPSINGVVLTYFFAAMCYRKAGRYSSYSQQLIKVLYLIKDYLVVENHLDSGKPDGWRDSSDYSALMKFILDYKANPLLIKILETTHWTQQTTGRPQVLKLEQLFGYQELETEPSRMRTLYNAISMHADMKEGVILFSELLLKAQKDNSEYLGKDFHLARNPVHAYTSVSNKFIRVLELNFRVHLNYQYLKESGLQNLLEHMNTWRKLSSHLSHSLEKETNSESNVSNNGYPGQELWDELRMQHDRLKDLPGFVDQSEDQLHMLISIRIILNNVKWLGNTSNLRLVLLHLIKIYWLQAGRQLDGSSIAAKVRKIIADILEKKDKSEVRAVVASRLREAKKEIDYNSPHQHWLNIYPTVFKAVKQMITQLQRFPLKIKSGESFAGVKERINRQLHEVIKELVKDAIRMVRTEYLVHRFNAMRININPDFDHPLESQPTMTELGKFLISDSIFCLTDILRNLNIYGISYMYNHSFQGFIRMYLADWSRYHHFFKLVFRKQLNQLNGCDEGAQQRDPLKLEQLVAGNILHFLDPKYNQEKAITHFHQALEMHNEGKAYRTQLGELYYMEDDFNDNLYHFCAALERYKINAGMIRGKIEMLKEEVRNSRFYQYSSYVNVAGMEEA